nr:defensin Ec-AMP-D2 [Ipomoea batatas]
MTSSLKSITITFLLLVLLSFSEMGPIMLGEAKNCVGSKWLCFIEHCNKKCWRHGYKNGNCGSNLFKNSPCCCW